MIIKQIVENYLRLKTSQNIQLPDIDPGYPAGTPAPWTLIKWMWTL
jgi:hypothetical protein